MKEIQTAVVLAAVVCSALVVAQEVVPVRPPGEAPGQADPTAGGDFYKASDLIGMTVQGADGQPMGTVTDLLIDSRTEQVRYMLLESETLVQREGELLILPAAVAEFNYFVDQPDQRFIRVDIDRQRIREAPTIPRAEIEVFKNPRWVTDVDQFYKVRERRVLRPDVDRPGIDTPRERRQERREDRRD